MGRRVAIIKIAGKGTRINSNVPKQYIEVNGCPIFIYTLMPFNSCELIDSICLVCDSEHLNYVKDQCKKFNMVKVKYFCIGGKNGNISTFNGYYKVKDILQDDDIVISHDGVRALVSPELIIDSIRKAEEFGSAIASFKPSGNVLFEDDDTRFIGRDDIYIAQTPISLTNKIMKECYSYYFDKEESIQNKFVGLDDIIFLLGHSIAKSKGDTLNFKITTDSDLIMFKALIENNVIVR